MEPTTTVEAQPVAAVLEEASAIVDQVSNYSGLITDSLYVIIDGMIAVFSLQTDFKVSLSICKTQTSYPGCFRDNICSDSGSYHINGG